MSKYWYILFIIQFEILFSIKKIIACENGHFEIVEYLLGQKANVNTKDAHDYTPLHFAVMANSLDIVKLLLKTKIEINALNDENKTALK